MKRGALLIISILLLYILYLYALNGRYAHTDYDSPVMFDKWKRQWIMPSDESCIEVR